MKESRHKSETKRRNQIMNRLAITKDRFKTPASLSSIWQHGRLRSMSTNRHKSVKLLQQIVFKNQAAQNAYRLHVRSDIRFGSNDVTKITQSEIPTAVDDSDSPLVNFMSEILIALHDRADLNWLSTTCLTALAFRLLICLPVRVYQLKLKEKRIAVQPMIDEQMSKRIKFKFKTQFASPEVQRELALEVRMRSVWENSAQSKNLYPVHGTK